jgi:hypothetical protein
LRALLDDGRAPATAIEFAPAIIELRILKLPFQQMGQQHQQTAIEFAAVALAHVAEHLQQMLDIQLLEATRAQQVRVALRPDGVVGLIKRCKSGHGASRPNRNELMRIRDAGARRWH